MNIDFGKRVIFKIISSLLGFICFILLSGAMFDNITALQTETTPTSITLTWAAPGNGNNSETAWQYDVRYSTTLITDQNWITATQSIGEPNPQQAGNFEEFTVENLSPDVLYYFAIKTIDCAGNISGLSNVDTARTLSLVSNIDLPTSHLLSPNYPNPFNAYTVINFYVPAPGHVKLSIYDILGRRVSTIVDELLSIGEHSAKWDGRDGQGNPVATGIYFYHLRVGDRNTSRKMLLLK